VKPRIVAIALGLVLCLFWRSAGGEPPSGEESERAAAEVEEVLGRLEERMSRVRTLETRFIQEKRLAILEEPLVLKGSVYMEKPALFAWHVREPLAYSMVIRDEVVRQWDEDTGRVQTLSLDRNPAFEVAIRQMRDWFAGAYGSILEEYEVRLLGEAPVSLEFVPREGGFAAAVIESVSVVFAADERYIREMRIAEKGGDGTRLAFSDTRLNAPIDASAWQVEPRVR
jgi:outer membrane lipoprotein-sorting protein